MSTKPSDLNPSRHRGGKGHKSSTYPLLLPQTKLTLSDTVLVTTSSLRATKRSRKKGERVRKRKHGDDEGGCGKVLERQGEIWPHFGFFFRPGFDALVSCSSSEL